MKTYQDQSIVFEYPDGWKLSREDGTEEYAVSVEGPGTALWIVSVNFTRPPADEQLLSVLESFRSEYPGCDVYEAEQQICLLPTASKDLDFFKFELVSHAYIRACETETATIVVICQVSDNDAVELGEHLHAMTESLMHHGGDLDDDDESEIDIFKYHNLFGQSDEDE